MPIDHYGVLKARPIARRLATGSSSHYQLELVTEDGTLFRCAINVKSKKAPSEVLYHVKSFFQHPITGLVQDLGSGFHPLASKPDSAALDLIRSNVVTYEQMTPLAFNVPGPDNDLNEKLDQIVQRAMSDEKAMVYAFGQRWGPETKADNYFGFKPGNGIHDIHMNQGNVDEFVKDDGVWQDGGLLFEFPLQKQWTAVFLAFQSQSWHTDDKNGHAIDIDGVVEGRVRILAAMVNSKETPEKEYVYLINRSDRALALDGWQLGDKVKAKMVLEGSVAAGGILRVDVIPPVTLSNRGGIITLLDDKDLKVHGVSYTREQAAQVGWTLVF